MKNHPNAEEWMSFLYGEAAPARHAELDAHLQDCAACREQVGTWRGSMAALDAWPLRPPAPRTFAQPALRWAAAAVVVLGLGFGLGRVTHSSATDVKQLQATLRSEMDARLATARDEFAAALRQQQTDLAQAAQTIAAEAATEEAGAMMTRFAKLMDERREADHETFTAAIKRMEERHLNNYTALRNDLDTVAVNADDEISRAQEQLMELATIAKPSGH